MEFSKLIGKRILSTDGEAVGYALKAYLSQDLTALECLWCADDEENEFALLASSIQKIGDAIIAVNEKTSAPVGIPCPVGKAVFDEQGNLLGVASALTSGANGTLTVVGPCGEKEFSVKRICAGDTVMIRSKRDMGSKKEQKRISQEPQSEKKTDSAPTLPDSIYRMNLLGKILKTPLSGIAEAGETVTAETIKRAHESNRLLELTAAVLQSALVFRT